MKLEKPSSNDMTDNARTHQQSLNFSVTSGVSIYNFSSYQAINTLKKQEKMFEGCDENKFSKILKLFDILSTKTKRYNTSNNFTYSMIEINYKIKVCFLSAIVFRPCNFSQINKQKQPLTNLGACRDID